MSEGTGPEPRLTGADIDFDAAYRRDQVVSGTAGATGVGLPWDIGGPQPAVVELERLGRFRGDVLDIGCGAGDNSLFLADRGYRVTGLDSAPAAVDAARRKAGDREVEFAVADATELSGYDGRFDAVLDSALYHALAADVRPRYVAGLHRATRPGALLSVLCFTDALRGVLAGLAVTEAGLRSTLTAAGWTVTALDQVPYTVRAAGMLAALKTGGGPVPEVDAAGRARLPMWRALAERA